MRLELSDWHGIQSGIEFITYIDHDPLCYAIMEALESNGYKVHTRSELFIITDKITKSELQRIIGDDIIINVH